MPNHTSSVAEVIHSTNRQSIIDNNNKSNLSIIDNRQSIVEFHTERLRTLLHDPLLGSGFVALALAKLGEGKVNDIANWALRKAEHPGKAFVKTCSNNIKP